MLPGSLTSWFYDRKLKKFALTKAEGIRDAITERIMMLSKMLRRKIELFACFQRKSGSPERALSALILNSLRATLPSYLPSCSP